MSFDSICFSKVEQQFAHKAGALNLARQYDKEKLSMKLNISYCLTQSIKVENFQAKREFLFLCDGAATISQWIRSDQLEYMSPDKKSNLQSNLFILLCDIVRSEPSLLSTQDTRVVFGKDAELIAALLKYLKEDNIKSTFDAYDNRENILKSLQRIYRKSP